MQQHNGLERTELMLNKSLPPQRADEFIGLGTPVGGASTDTSSIGQETMRITATVAFES